MRILIIANQRTGSTTLGQWLSYELNYRFINEPKTPIEILESDVVVKSLYIALPFKDFNINDLIKKYDKIIGLTRKDTFECAISLLYCQENYIKYPYHGIYNVDDKWISNRKEKIEILSNSIEEMNLKLKLISGI